MVLAACWTDNESLQTARCDLQTWSLNANALQHELAKRHWVNFQSWKTVITVQGHATVVWGHYIALQLLMSEHWNKS